MTAKTQITGSTTLPLNELRIDDKINVRTIGRGIDPVLLASIKALGVLDPLHVRPNGKGYVVHAGGQRLLALQALAKTGDIKPDAAIPVVVHDMDDAAAREISLAENVARQAMHPVDEFRAFSALHTDKTSPLDVEAIATRFGVNAKIVKQRLALGALDDVILSAWQKGDLREREVQAFTLQPDKKAQATLYAKLKKAHSVYSDTIRSEIRGAQQNVSTMLDAVTVKAYEKRGGTLTRDLFGDDVLVSDFTLLQTMIGEKIADLAENAKAEGWGFVETETPENEYDYGRLEIPFKPTADERAKLKKLSAQSDDGDEDAYDKHDTLQAAITQRGLTPEIKAKGGVRITFERSGFAIRQGIVKPKDKTGVTVDAALNNVRGGKDKTKKAAGLTKALTDRLTEQRQAAIKAAILTDTANRDPLGKLLAGIVSAQINPGRYNAAPHQVVENFDTIAKTVSPKVMNAALRKAFDQKGYFEGAGKSFCLAAITEAVNADEARKASKGKKGEIAKFALTNAGKTGWLPKELRTPHYDGPKGKAKAAVKAKAKKK